MGIRLEENTLEIELSEQLLEQGTLVVVTGGVAGLSDRHSQGCGVQRHLGDKRGTAATGGLDRAAKGFAITDQLIEIICPTWDLSDRPVTNGSADGSDIHLQEEVAKGGIRRRALELKSKGLGQHSVVTPGKTLKIAEALALAQDPEHRDKQQVPGRNADTPPHPSIRDRLEVADQIEIGCGRNALAH